MTAKSYKHFETTPLPFIPEIRVISLMDILISYAAFRESVDFLKHLIRQRFQDVSVCNMPSSTISGYVRPAV